MTGIDVISDGAGTRSVARGVGEDRAANSGHSFRTALQESAVDGDDEATRVREAAEQLVASAFVLPVLEALRESPFLEGPFAPGTAERRFAPLLDTAIADRVVQASNFGLVDAVIDRLLRPVPPSAIGERVDHAA